MPASTSVSQAACKTFAQGAMPYKCTCTQRKIDCYLMRRHAFVMMSMSNILQPFWLHDRSNGWHHRSSTCCKHMAVPASI